MKAVIDLGKVGLTFGGVWQTGKNYEKLTFVLNKLSNGGDGCGYIAIEDSNSVRPDTDPTRWQKASEVGESIYDLCVARGYQGTEDQFVAEYNAAVAAANAAAASASAVEAQVAAAEALRVSAENGRVQAEYARQAAEQARQDAEAARVAAENARVAADNLRQQTFEVQSAQMTTAIGLAETATAAANAATEAANAAAASANAAAAAANAAAEAASSIETRLMNGTLVPVKAGNLESWSERDALSVEDTHADGVRTTAGDTSIVTDAGARVVSIVARTDFFASDLRATGFNLLHGAVAVGAGYYILVPALEFGSYGTAAKPNGILFTDSAGNNLQPTVRFKALSAGVPTSVNDGSACTYVDSNNHRFFTTPGVGYLIISGITLASTCAHVAWSRRYDEFIAPDAASDAGSSIALSSIIHAIHSFDRMLVVGSVADRIEFGDSAATWTRNVDRTVPSWTNTDNGDGTYTHTATIATMRPDGAVDCPGVNLSVEGTTISYTDSSAVASSDYVKFELATPVTGTVSVSPALAVEDWGLEVLDGIVGSAYVTMRYAQSYPDSLAALAAGVNAAKMQALVEAIAALRAEVDSLRKGIDRGGRFEADSVSSRSVPLYNGFPIILSAPGVPAANLVPYEWDRETMGEWDGIPSFIGQTYINTAATGAAQVAYHAKGNAAVADWK